MLSPETSEDDINRLDSKVKVEPFDFGLLMLLRFNFYTDNIYFCIMYLFFVFFWKVFSKLGNGGVKYDELYAWLISLLEAGSEFDTARRQENKPITPMVIDSAHYINKRLFFFWVNDHLKQSA